MPQALLGIPFLIFLAWLTSVDRRRFPLKLVIAGTLLQVTLAALFLKVPLLQDLLLIINRIVLTLEAAMPIFDRAAVPFIPGFRFSRWRAGAI